jgi:hypothetical protein
VAERFIGPVDIDGELADRGLLRVNGPTVPVLEGGKGPLVGAKIKHQTGQGEIECGDLLAHRDVRVEGDVDVTGSIDVTADITVDGDLRLKGDLVAEKLAEIMAKLADIEQRLTMVQGIIHLPDGRFVNLGVLDLIDRVKRLEHDAKAWYDGGPIFG